MTLKCKKKKGIVTAERKSREDDSNGEPEQIRELIFLDHRGNPFLELCLDQFEVEVTRKNREWLTNPDILRIKIQFPRDNEFTSLMIDYIEELKEEDGKPHPTQQTL